MKAILGKLLHNRLYMMNVGSSFLSQLFSALYVIILTPRLLQSLGEISFAQYGIILSAITIGSILDLGMNTSILRRVIHEKEKQNALFITLVSFYGALFVLMLVLLSIFSYTSVTFFKGLDVTQLILLLVLVLQSLLVLLLDNLVQSTQKIYIAKSIRCLKTFLELVCILLSLQYHSLSLVLVIIVAFNFLFLVGSFIYARQALQLDFSWIHVNLNLFFDHLKYSFWYYMTALSAVMVFQSQVFIVNAISGTTLVVQFLLFNRFFDIIRMAVSNFTAVLYPSIVFAESEQRHRDVRSLFFNALFRALLILCCIFCVLFFTGKDLFLWWTHGQVAYDHTVFWLLLVYSILILVDNVSAVFLSALKLNKLPTIVSLVQGLLVVLLTTVLVPRYGLIGLGIASIAALASTSLFFNPFFLLKKLHVAKD